jgi:Zn-finger nucleic acid-binding protein
MKCPVCDNVRMREVEKDGVKIDVCPDCKGVWLDRGELEKLMQGVRDMNDDLNALEQQQEGVQVAAPGAQYGSSPSGTNTQQNYGGPHIVYSQGYQENAQPPQQAQPGSTPHTHNGGGQPSPDNYNSSQPPQYGTNYGRERYDYGTKQGYDKHGVPYKKKKSVLDVFGDLFD